MRNSIRPYRLASLRSKGEAQTLPAGGEAHGAAGLEMLWGERRGEGIIVAVDTNDGDAPCRSRMT